MRGGRTPRLDTHTCTETDAHLQEAVDAGDRTQHDDEKKNIQSDAGQQEGPFGGTTTTTKKKPCYHGDGEIKKKG